MFDKTIECMSRNNMKSLQLERLKTTIRRAYDRVPFYKNKFDQIGLKPSMINSLDDLRNIPFTVKDDLRDNYPFGMFACGTKDIARIHASSGTTGKPTVVAYTRNDLQMWTDCVARIVVMAGVTDEDVAQISFGYGLFTGALGLHQGLERVGAVVVPISSGQTEKQLMLMQDFGTTTLICTPSYGLHLGETAKELGVDMSAIKLKYALLGADRCSDDMRNTLEGMFGLCATENYGLSEIVGPGVSGECQCKDGLHINEDCFIPEIIHPDTGEQLPPGELGELVLTTITKEALPLLRYRTKDLTRLVEEPCRCGRTLTRHIKIQGRTDDMLIINGVNLFPSQIEVALSGIPHIAPHFQMIATKSGAKDELKVVVELDSGDVLDSFAELKSLEQTIQHSMRVVTGLNIKTQIVAPKTIQRVPGKVKRVFDERV